MVYRNDVWTYYTNRCWSSQQAPGAWTREPPTEYSPMYAGHVRRSLSTTVNVDITMQYIFSRRALAESNFDMSENYNHNIIE